MDTCPNCQTAVTDSYCPTCGQKYEDERFTLPSIFSALLKEVVDLESGALKTLVGLSTAPGRVVRDYWQRCTKPYLNPAKYFLFAATVFQLVLWQTGAAGNLVEGFLAAEEGSSVSQARALRFLGEYFVLMFATGLPVLTVASYWGTERNLAEHAIFHLYVSGHVALFWGFLFLVQPLLSITSYSGKAVFGIVFLASPASYYVWTYVSAHQPDTGHGSVREAIQALGTLILFVVLYVFVYGVSVGVYTGVTGGGAS